MDDKYALDSHKLHLHPERVAQWLRDKDEWETAKAIYPIYVEVSPVGGCNHSCLMCGVDYVLEANAAAGKIPQLDPGIFGAALLEMGRAGVKSLMFAGAGEPTLYKPLNSMTRTATLAGIDVALTTNGILLDKVDVAQMTWVKISFNGGTREAYEAVHKANKGDYDRVTANIRDAVNRAGKCTIGMQMVLLPENAHTVDDFKRLSDELKVEYAVIKPFSQHHFSVNKQYAKFDPRAIKIVDQGRLLVRRKAMEAVSSEIPYDKCLATPHFWAYISENGDVYGCSAYLLDERFNYGNINKHTFKEIWEGEKRHESWRYIREDLDISECRQSCRMDSVNRYLTQVVNGVPHGNFI